MVQKKEPTKWQTQAAWASLASFNQKVMLPRGVLRQKFHQLIGSSYLFVALKKLTHGRKEVKITQKQLLKSGKIRTVPAYLGDSLRGRFCGFSEIFCSVYNEGVHVLPVAKQKMWSSWNLAFREKRDLQSRIFLGALLVCIYTYIYIFIYICVLYMCVYIYICRYIIHGFFQLSFLQHIQVYPHQNCFAPSMPWKNLG